MFHRFDRRNSLHICSTPTGERNLLDSLARFARNFPTSPKVVEHVPRLSFVATAVQVGHVWSPRIFCRGSRSRVRCYFRVISAWKTVTNRRYLTVCVPLDCLAWCNSIWANEHRLVIVLFSLPLYKVGRSCLAWISWGGVSVCYIQIDREFVFLCFVFFCAVFFQFLLSTSFSFYEVTCCGF